MIFHSFRDSYPFNLVFRHTVGIVFIPCDREAKPGITHVLRSELCSLSLQFGKQFESCHDIAIQWFSISVVSSVCDKHFNGTLAIIFMINKSESHCKSCYTTTIGINSFYPMELGCYTTISM